MTAAGIQRRTWLRAAALASVLSALAAGAAQAAPSRLVFTDFASSGGSTSSDIFAVRADGTHLRHLTHGGADEYEPAWSPKRRFVAFARASDRSIDIPVSRLFRMRANGTHVRKIPHTKFGDAPSWSPNGRKLAFVVTNASARKAVFTIRPDGTHRKRLTPFGIQTGSPDWSPNGKSIVYASPHGIKRMRANGSHKRALTDSGREPSWSPNGKRIAFSDTGNQIPQGSDIYTIRANGTDRRNLTDSRPAASCDDLPDQCARVDEHPSWSPNGKRISFNEILGNNGEAGIFTIRPDGTGANNVRASGSEADWR